VRVDEQQERIGRNEALYRSINERLEELNDAFAKITETFTVVCECGDALCTEQVTVDVREYERVRSDPSLFFVRPGHVAPDVEVVVEADDAYEVVRKREGEPAELARELDHRSN
jgi:hypothetical protein